jgi:hypothetical protein
MNVNGVIWSWRFKQKCEQIDFVSHQQIVQLFCDRGSLEGAIKKIRGTQTDLLFLYLKLLLNFNDSFQYYYCLYIWHYCAVLSGKLAMAITGHAMLIDPQCKSLTLKIVSWPAANASFTTDSIIIIHTKARSYKHWADLWLCARCLVFKLHFSYLLNRRLRGCLHNGGWDDFDVLK